MMRGISAKLPARISLLRLRRECDRSAAAPWRLTSLSDVWQTPRATPRSGVSRSVRVDPAGSFLRRDTNGKKSSDDVSRGLSSRG